MSTDVARQVLTRPPGAARAAAARRWAVDLAIAAVVTAAQVVGSYGDATWHHAMGSGRGLAGAVSAPGPAGYVLLAVGGVALAARRRFPVSVLAVTLATALGASALGASVVWLALIVAFFTAVLARKRVAAVAALVTGYLASVWPPWQIGTPGHAGLSFALGLAIGLAFLLCAAEVIRSRSQRAAALAHGREQELRRLASEERMRMARDLHDVVAHNISVINVQANTALHLMDRQPERARTALVTINEVSRQALVELRSVLGVLRDAGEQAPRSPSPGLARLADLVDTAAAAGLTVTVTEAGRRVPLPADLDLAAYRIIQEALTNAARHSGGGHATVRLGYPDPDGQGLPDGQEPAPGGSGPALTVAVTDDGSGGAGGQDGPGSGPGSGSGIAGMTERAAALGGTLRAGPGPDGGFAVRARLPLPGSQR
jgi:signal transduction histidine kinase